MRVQKEDNQKVDCVFRRVQS